MPVATAGLADVGVADPRERVGRGVEQQLLARAARLLLHEPALVELATDGRGAGGQVVANALELR